MAKINKVTVEIIENKGFKTEQYCLDCDKEWPIFLCTPLDIAPMKCWECFKKEACSKCRSRKKYVCKRCLYYLTYKSWMMDKFPD